MTKSSYAKKLLSIVLSLTMLLSCMVWTGVSAEQQTLSCDFTDYAVTAKGDVDQNGGSKAQVVDSGDATHGQVMKLYYESGATTDKAGFRFFAGTGTKFQYDNGTPNTYTKVTFSYQVQKLNGGAKLNVMSGSINWTGETFNSNQALGSENHKTVATLAAAATPGTWQTVSVVVGSHSSQNSAIHIYLQADNAANEAGSSVYIDDVTIVTEYDPSSEPDATYSFPIDDLTKTNVTGNGSGNVVKTGAEYDHSGSATGKGMYMKMNQPYNAAGVAGNQNGVAYVNAARFWLENADGQFQPVVGAKYVVTAWVKSMRSEADDLYWTIGTADRNTKTNATVYNTEEATFASNKVTLQPGVWTKVTTTVDALVGAGGSVNYMTFAAGFAAAHDGEYVYVDDITIEEYRPDTPVEIPPLAATTQPAGTLLGTQTFEQSTDMDDYVVDISAARNPVIDTTVNYTADGSNSLAVELKKGTGNNGNASRPRFMVKLGDATTADNYAVEAGGSYNLSFWVRSSRKTTSFGFYVSTMTDPTQMLSFGSASDGKNYRTIQVASSNLGTAAESQSGTEFSKITLEANQWTQVVVTIPEVKAHGTDANAAQYLCIHYTDTGCYSDNPNFTDRTLYMDDVSLYKVVDQWKVNYDTNGGDTLASTVGDKNSQVTLAEPYKLGYTYTGWYTDPDCTPESKVSSPYTLAQKEITLYTEWEKSEPEQVSLVQDFESATSIEQFTTRENKPFELVNTGNHTDGGSKALKTTVKNGWNGNFNRPLWAFQMNDGDGQLQDNPLQVIPGMPATVTFSIMATRDVGSIGYMIDTVNSMDSLNADAGSSSAANSYRNMEVLASSKFANGSDAGKLNGNNNEVSGISLKAGEWATITAEISSIQGFKSGAQYLVLAIGDTLAYSADYDTTKSYDLYIDDIQLNTLVGGHAAKVTYDTMGGDPMADGVGVVWADVIGTPTRAGYEFDGWFTDESCSIPVTTFDLEYYNETDQAFHLYAGWRPADAQIMHFEVDDSYTPQVYADVDLDDAAVQGYYSGLTNMSKTSETMHSLVDDATAGKVIIATVGTAANASTHIYGIRLVGKDSVSAGFKATTGTAYSVTFRYKVEALPVATEIRVLEGSINWQGNAYNKRSDKDGIKITSADVGAGWKTGTINFESTLSEGVHLALHASDYTQRGGTVVYFDDIVVSSYQLSEFTTSDAATRVEDATKNHTENGSAALKIDNSGITDDAQTGRVVYASGIGNELFATNTINTATAWLYSETDTEAAIGIFSEPDLTKMDELTAEQLVDVSDLVELKAGVWTRVQVEFALPSLAGEEETYVSIAVASWDEADIIYMDDISVGVYNSDPSIMQTYEELEEGEHPNSPYFDGYLHGLNGNTVVSGKGYDGSDKSLEISMQGETEEDASRAVLFFDKMDATAAVNGGYIVTFYAMAEEDLDVTFGLGTSGTIDLSNMADQATLHEAEATSTVSLTAGKWQGVSVFVSDLQGKNPEMTTNPYVTLAAWFDGAAADNSKSVYIDNVTFRSYAGSEAAKEDILCFENTEAFGFGKQLSLNANGSMEVVLEQNHTTGGNYSLKVTTEGLTAIGGATRPQFNLMNANGDAIRLKKGQGYRVSFWVYFGADAEQNTLRYWLTLTNETESYTDATNQQRKDEVIYEASNFTGTKGEWKQITYTIPAEDVTEDGYIRLGISGTGSGAKTVFYLDDLRVMEYKNYTLTGQETVQDYENYNLEDGSDFIRRGTGYVSDEVNHTKDGEKSLRLQGVSNAGYNRNQMIVIDPATHKPYEFIKGRGYTLTFWVYCSDEYTDNFSLNTWLWGTDNANLAFTKSADKNDKNGTFEWDGGLAPVTEDGAWIPGEWNQYSISFTAKNGKYMLWGMTDGGRTDGNYVYYVDDIEIDVLEPAVVTFDANGGAFNEMDKAFLNDKGQYVANGYVGLTLAESVSFADPYLTGKKFDGWALDKEGKQLFDIDTDTVPSTELTLYAVWGEWTNDDGYAQIDKTDKDDKDDKDEVKYRTEIQYEEVWTGNAAIPVLEAGDRPELEDADPVTYIPDSDDDPTPVTDGLPVWLIIVIIVAAVVVVGGGAFLALLLLKNKKSDDEKEVNA